MQFTSSNWPYHPRVHALTTRRHGGVSTGAYAGLNLANHVEDDARAVSENRRRLIQRLDLPTSPFWLKQVHGIEMYQVTENSIRDGTIIADGAHTTLIGQVLAILTADCTPLLMMSDKGNWIAAVHVGWRGLQRGIVESILECAPVAQSELLAWLGPTIGPRRFEIGADVKSALGGSELAYQPAGRVNKYFCDLRYLIAERLSSRGVNRISQSDDCTYSQPQNYYSHRRSQPTGRMATLIWMTPH